MRRAVVDLNVLVSALIAPQGRPAAVLTAWLGGEFELIVSEGMLDDLAAVLGRPKLSSRVTTEQAARLVALLRTHSLVVVEPELVEPVTGDPEDDRVVAVARAACAELIVSGDTDLLDQAGARPPVVSPADLLRMLA